MTTTEKPGLILIHGTNPQEALKLPKGTLLHEGKDNPFDEAAVLECTQKILDWADVDEPFTTQAHIVAFAGNNIDWGAGMGYKAKE